MHIQVQHLGYVAAGAGAHALYGDALLTAAPAADLEQGPDSQTDAVTSDSYNRLAFDRLRLVLIDDEV